MRAVTAVRQRWSGEEYPRMRVDWIGDRLGGRRRKCRRGNDDALTHTRTNGDGREQAGRRRMEGQADEVR